MNNGAPVLLLTLSNDGGGKDLLRSEEGGTEPTPRRSGPQSRQSSKPPTRTSQSVLVGPLVIALGADLTELLVGTARPEGKLVAGSGPSANRTLRLVVHTNNSIGNKPKKQLLTLFPTGFFRHIPDNLDLALNRPALRIHPILQPDPQHVPVRLGVLQLEGRPGVEEDPTQ